MLAVVGDAGAARRDGELHAARSIVASTAATPPAVRRNCRRSIRAWRAASSAQSRRAAVDIDVVTRWRIRHVFTVRAGQHAKRQANVAVGVGLPTGPGHETHLRLVATSRTGWRASLPPDAYRPTFVAHCHAPRRESMPHSTRTLPRPRRFDQHQDPCLTRVRVRVHGHQPLIAVAMLALGSPPTRLPGRA